MAVGEQRDTKTTKFSLFLIINQNEQQEEVSNEKLMIIRAIFFLLYFDKKSIFVKTVRF